MSEQFASPMDLLFDEESLLLGIEAEDAVGGNIGAGLDWGSAIGQLMLNPGLFSRLTTLRVSLNREVRWAKPRLRRSLRSTMRDMCALEKMAQLSQLRGMSSIRAENRVKRYYISKTSI